MKIHTPEPLAGHQIVNLFYFKFAPHQQVGGLFRENLPPNFFETDVTFVELDEAEAIVLPNNFLHLDTAAREYIGHHLEGARVPVVAFSFGDLTHDLRFDPRLHVLRLSTYRSLSGARDYLVSTLVDDPAPAGITVRPKTPLPQVSFCGQASFRGWQQWLRYGAKWAVYTHLGLLWPKMKAQLVGIYWRRRAMQACAASPLLTTDFIIRRSFSGSTKTIELPAEEARQQFLENMQGSNFVLAPKGDGNYSNRMIEAVAMGRIPVIIDTDIVLPLESEIDYTKISVLVPMHDIANTAKYIREFYDPLSPEEWEARQLLARETFEKFLRQDQCLRHVFKTPLVQ